MPKHSPNTLSITIYMLLTLVTATAIAIPPAVATNLLPDTKAGALVLIGSVALLLLTLVIEVWRHTGNAAKNPFQQPPPPRLKPPLSAQTTNKKSKETGAAQ